MTVDVNLIREDTAEGKKEYQWNKYQCQCKIPIKNEYEKLYWYSSKHV